MAQIFIAITVDAITLGERQDKGTWDSPISLGANKKSDVYIEMMTQNSSVVKNQGKSELNVRANVGDEIVFTISAPGAGENYYPILYDADIDNHNVKSLGPNTAVWNNYCLDSGGSGTEPTFTKSVPSGYPNEGQPNTFICPQWLFQVNGVGESVYHFKFAVVNTQTGEKGFFKWDPFVTISN